MKLYLPVLLRYLLAFLIFAFFLLLLFIPTWYYIFSFNMNNEIGFVTDKLKAGIDIIDSTITALNNEVIFSSTNHQFRVLRHSLQNVNSGNESINPYLLIEFRNYLSSIFITKSLIADSGLITSAGVSIINNRIFSYPGFNVYYGNYIKSIDYTKEEWLHLLKENKQIIPALYYQSMDHGIYEALTISIHWSYSNFPEENILFATIPVNRIISLIMENDIAEKGSVSIYNADGTVLYIHEAISSGKMTIISEQSSVSGLRFEIGIPDQIIREKIQPLRNMILLFTVMVAVITLSLSLFFAWKTTKPVQIFLDTLKSTKMINSEYMAYYKNLSLNPFKGFMQIFNGVGESISNADRKLEISFRTIEHETQLLKARIIDKILEALEGGNPEIACTILHETVTILQSQEDPQLYNLIYGLFLDMARELKNKYPGILDDAALPADISDDYGFYFKQLLPDYFQQVCTLLKFHREKNITKFEQAVLDFINNNLFNTDLYITMISDQFKISSPSIQKLIRKVSGQSYLNYVENLRLNKACEILKAGVHSISETSSLCGFTNANSFSRAFKRVYGFPPTIMRS